jgi:hypothetical protein
MTTKRKPKPDIEYGDVDIPDEAFRPENVRMRISIMVPEDIVNRIKDLAAAESMPYQTFINRLLRDATMGEKSIDARLQRVEQAITDLRKAG